MDMFFAEAERLESVERPFSSRKIRQSKCYGSTRSEYYIE